MISNLAHTYHNVEPTPFLCYLNIWNVTDNAPLFNSLDKCVARPVVSDGQAEGVLCLGDLDLLGSTLSVGEYEVVQSDLAAQEVTHVHLVCVEGAEEDLHQERLSFIQVQVQEDDLPLMPAYRSTPQSSGRAPSRW